MPSAKGWIIASTCAAGLLIPALQMLRHAHVSSELLWDLAAGSWLVVSLWIW